MFSVIKKHINYIVDYFIGGCLCVMASILFVQIVLRYLLKSPLFWSEELARLLFVWLTFVGASAVYRIKGHITVEILLSRMPRSACRKLAMINISFVAIFGVAMLYWGLMMAIRFWGMLTPALRLPRGLFFLAVCVGGFFLIIETIQQFLETMRGDRPLDGFE